MTQTMQIKENKYILALDAGGTMTDTFLMKGDGHFIVGKALTNKADESISYLESVNDAAGFLGLNSTEVHKDCLASIYAGTGMLNTILTGQGNKVGLLVTRGFEHITVLEGGLTYLGQTQNEILHQQLHEHTRPMVDPKNVKGITERISGGSYFGDSHIGPGKVLIPLSERDVRQGVNELLDAGVEVIGILFINSFVSPEHEEQAKKWASEVVEERGRDVPVVTSNAIAPVMRENNRVKSLLFQCFAAEKTREQLLEVEKVAKSEGYKSELLTLLSYGGAVNARYPKLYETVISGPIGGIIGAKTLAQLKHLRNVVTADLGGTSFDVGILLDNNVEIIKDPDFAAHRLALPMVAIDSAGTGAGSVIHLDSYNRMEIGPESAGSKVGVCYEFPDLTVTDINVALGYVDPNNFLGGKIKLNKERTLAVLEERIARPLGVDVYEAGRGILELANTQMKDLLLARLLAKGYNPREFTLLAYGGAGPVHMWGFTEDVPFQSIITVPWAAAFSAFGAACSDYTHRYHKGIVLTLPNSLGSDKKAEYYARMNQAWEELEEQAINEMTLEGIKSKDITFTYGVYAHYIGQLESFDTPLPFQRKIGNAGLDRVIEAFEKMYTKIYPEGARFPDVGYAITEVYIQATAPKPSPVIPVYHDLQAIPGDSAYKGTRKVFHQGQWINFQVWEMSELKAGNVVNGPSIIEDAMTTVVIPPNKKIEFDEHRVLWMKERSKTM